MLSLDYYRIKEHLKQQDREKNEEITEGAELKRLAAQYELEKKRLEEIQQAEAGQLMSDNLKQMDDVRKMRKIQQQQEEVRKISLTHKSRAT